MDDQRVRSQPEFDASLMLVERFPRLVRTVKWLEEGARHEYGLDEWEFQAVVSLSAMLIAVRGTADPDDGDPTPPEAVTRAFLLLGSSPPACREDVTVPQLAAAYLAGGWAPQDARPFGARKWEPAALVLRAMTYKSTCHGLHALANKGVPPLQSERCERRGVFEQRVITATHTIALWLTSPQGPASEGGRSIRDWSCAERSLWEFVSDAVLGPGRAGGGDAGRPQPGAFTRSLLGMWCQATIGVMVKDVEQYFCESCRELHPEPTCPKGPSPILIATWSRRHLVTPRHRLSAEDREWGHEEAERKICKNPACAERLHRLLVACGRTPCGREPIYDMALANCPYCGTGKAGQRGKTVWTRHP